MPTTLGFHGAARTVTGSRYLLEARGQRTVVDAGLFQGFKKLRELNWREPPFPPHEVDQVLLTHAHIDHAGALPRLVKNGFSGPIYCTRSTRELARLLLLDSAKIHEEDARYANKKGHSKHQPALPLYTVSDAKKTLKQFKVIGHNTWLDLRDGLRARFHGAGHILGSCSIEVRIPHGKQEGTVVFSGEIGRYDMPLHLDPSPMPSCDVLICESTYGNRTHESAQKIDDQLCDPLLPTLERKGTVLIPAFAVGRSQQITLILRNLMNEGRLPEVPLHIDSPMAINATEIYGRHLDEHHLDREVFEDGRTSLFPRMVELDRSVQASKRLNNLDGPRIIVSASGMLTAGRVIHHLKRLVRDPKNLVVLAGYQAAGTRGRALLGGSPTVRVHGRDIPVRSECISIHGLSAHADKDELLRWVRSGRGKPRKVFLTHGEPESAFAFAHTIRRELSWSVEVPELDEEVDLDLYFRGSTPASTL